MVHFGVGACDVLNFRGVAHNPHIGPFKKSRHTMQKFNKDLIVTQEIWCFTVQAFAFTKWKVFR